MTVDEYEAEALNDIKLNPEYFKDYCQVLGTKRIKWSRYRFNEELTLNTAEDKLRELYREKFHYYAYEYPEKIDKKNIEIYIKSDDDYRKAQQAVLKQEAKLKLVDEVINSLDKQSFQCSNILKYMIWASGESVR